MLCGAVLAANRKLVVVNWTVLVVVVVVGADAMLVDSSVGTVGPATGADNAGMVLVLVVVVVVVV